MLDDLETVASCLLVTARREGTALRPTSRCDVCLTSDVQAVPLIFKGRRWRGARGVLHLSLIPLVQFAICLSVFFLAVYA